MLGQQPRTPAQRRRIGRRLRQLPGRTGGDAVELDLAAGDDVLRAGVLQAGLHALGRGIGFERQPGRAGLGDGGLHQQQFVPARQAQADDIARPHARLDQVVRGQVGAPAQRFVGDGLILPMDGDGVGMTQDRGFENIRQRFRDQQIRPVRAMENHR